MKRLTLRIAALAAAILVMAGNSSVSAAAQATPADSASMAIGTVLGATMGRIVGEFEQGGVALDRDIVAQAAMQAINGRHTGLSLDRAQSIVDHIMATMQKSVAVVDSFDTASQERFLAEAAAKPGTVRTPSGVVLEVLTEGEGAMPDADDSVRISYVGFLSDGSIFDATDDPVIFPLAELTPGLAEGLAMMRPGGRYRVTIPSAMAYGEQGIPGIIPGRAALQFRVEMIGIVPKQDK